MPRASSSERLELCSCILYLDPNPHLLCGFCKSLRSPACSQEVIPILGTLQQPRSLQQCLAAEQTSVTKTTEKGWWQSEHTLLPLASSDTCQAQ